jgi:hypothetical protein|tara:strand:- start:214 stop:546 length:333 start_codon:yes stop_codon:yes gene_type:complete
MIKKYIKQNRNNLIAANHLPMITCRDGFRISVQCGYGHYSSPKVLNYRDPLPRNPTHFELGFPSQYEELIYDFAEDKTYSKKNLDTVFGWVPIGIVNKVIRKHGGIKEDA